MVGAAESAQRKDQIDPAVMQNQALEIHRRGRQVRVNDQRAHGRGQARAEHERHFFVAPGRPQSADVDVLQPPVTVIYCLKQGQKHLKRFRLIARSHQPFELGKRRSRGIHMSCELSG